MTLNYFKSCHYFTYYSWFLTQFEVLTIVLFLSLFLTQRRATDECYFFERLEANNYNTYRSRKYPNWYVALKRTGQYKSGANTGPGQKAILFLPMSAKS